MTTIAQLDALIDELTTDAYGDDEQLTGFLTGAEEALRRGEPAQIVGVDLDVLAVNAGPDLRTGLSSRTRKSRLASACASRSASWRARACSMSSSISARRRR
jgi:hypothetical protein